ncbi:MAG: cation:proton antiporter [bacterium]|nr:cation:proton antiporter [bacterium]
MWVNLLRAMWALLSMAAVFDVFYPSANKLGRRWDKWRKLRGWIFPPLGVLTGWLTLYELSELLPGYESSLNIKSDNHELVIGWLLVKISLLLGSAYYAVVFCRLRGIATVFGTIAVGLIYGPTVSGLIYIEPASDVGMMMLYSGYLAVIFLLLDAGTETELKQVGEYGVPVVVTGILSFFFPFLVGGFLLFLVNSQMPLPEIKGNYFVIGGLYMGIGAMAIVVRLLAEYGLRRVATGRMTVSYLAVNEIIAWIAVSAWLSTVAEGKLDWIAVGSVVLLAVVSIALSLTVGKTLLGSFLAWQGQSDYRNQELPMVVLSCALLGSGVSSLLFHSPFIGALVVGVMIADSDAFNSGMRRGITDIGFSFFIPLYFAGIGIKYDLGASIRWDLFAVLLLISMAVRFLAVYLSMILFDMPHRDRTVMGLVTMPIGVSSIIFVEAALNTGMVGEEFFVTSIAAMLASIAISDFLVGMFMRDVNRGRLPPVGQFLKPKFLSSSADEFNRWTQGIIACVGTAFTVLKLDEGRKRQIGSWLINMIQERKVNIAEPEKGHCVVITSLKVAELAEPCLLAHRFKRDIYVPNGRVELGCRLIFILCYPETWVKVKGRTQSGRRLSMEYIAGVWEMELVKLLRSRSLYDHFLDLRWHDESCEQIRAVLMHTEVANEDVVVEDPFSEILHKIGSGKGDDRGSR